MFARLATSAATVSATAAALVAASAVALAAPAPVAPTGATPASASATSTQVGAQGTTIPPTFAGCGVWAFATDAKGTVRYTGVAGTKPVTDTVLNRNTESMGFVPRAFTDTGVFVLGDSLPYYLAVAPNGYLWSYSLRYSDPGWGVEGRTEWTRFALTPGWKSFTTLTASNNDEASDGATTYLFGLTSTGTLRRYPVEVSDNGEGVLVLGGKTVTTRAADVKTMTWDRTQKVGGKLADVLLATTRTGRGVVYRDANRANFSGADISRGYAVPVTAGTHFGG